MTHEHPEERAPESAAEWDTRYGSEHIWSGNPNAALVAEASDLPAGTALDVGCGEGADAVWLAKCGWDVTALDVSTVAVERGRAAAKAAGVSVSWLVRGFTDAPLGEFDLVSAQYPAIRKEPHQTVERAFAEAVAPGGRLVVVHHDKDDVPHGFDPADYVMPGDIAEFVRGQGWALQADEVRKRHVIQGAGAHHTRDRIVVAMKPAEKPRP